MSSELIEIESIPYNEVATVESAELEVNFDRVIWPFDEDCSVYSFGFECVEDVDELHEGHSCVVDVLNDQDALASVVLWPQRSFDCEFSGGVEALVGLKFDELVAVGVVEEFDEVGVKHEGALEHADYHQVQGTLLRFYISVVCVDGVGDLLDDLADEGFVVE